MLAGQTTVKLGIIAGKSRQRAFLPTAKLAILNERGILAD